MSEWYNALEACLEIASSVPGVGPVYPDPINVETRQDVLLRLTTPEMGDAGRKRINCAFISRRSSDMQRGGTDSGAPLGSSLRTQVFLLRFYYQYSDDGLSVRDFRTLVDALVDAFEARPVVRGDLVVRGVSASEALDEFAGALCHSADIEIVLERHKMVNYRF